MSPCSALLYRRLILRPSWSYPKCHRGDDSQYSGLLRQHKSALPATSPRPAYKVWPNSRTLSTSSAHTRFGEGIYLDIHTYFHGELQSNFHERRISVSEFNNAIAISGASLAGFGRLCYGSGLLRPVRMWGTYSCYLSRNEDLVLQEVVLAGNFYGLYHVVSREASGESDECGFH